MMKQIKIFLASSICEFAQERQDLKGYISALNDIYVERGVYFKLILCENLGNALSSERKQEEYNQEIRDSQFFYVILGSEAGDYTREEFEVARKSFLEKQTPKIYTYFKQLPEGETKQSVLNFMDQLDKELGHYYSVFAHIDSIKLNILLELTRCDEGTGAVTLEEGTVKLDGKPMLSMEHIPLYSKNEAVQRLLQEKKQLEEVFAALTQMTSLMQDNPAYTRMLLENSKKRNALAEQLHTLEKDVLGLCRAAAEKRSLGQHLNWREQKALTFIDEGDYEAAKNLLRDETWKQEVAHAEETIDLATEPIREYISGQTTLIKTIKTGGVTAESATEIETIYDELMSLCEKHRIALTTLYDFAGFLEDQNKYAKAIRIAEQLKYYYDAPNSQVSMSEKSRLLNLLGILYNAQHRFAEGEAAYREALKIYRSLAEENADAYLPDVAMTCNNLAVLLDHQHRAEEAERLYREALEIRRSLAKENPDAYLPDVAMTCNNLAVLLDDQHRTEEAERLYREALEIRRSLAEENPDACLPDVAMTCNNLAILLKNQHRTEEAERLYREALKIYRSLAEENPDAVLPNVAMTCNNLAALLDDQHRTEEAERLYREALKIYRSLARENADAYLPDVAATCNNLAVLLDHQHRAEEAERLYREALEIRRSLAKENPDAYLPDVAMTCNNLAVLLDDQHRTEEAERLCREALEIRRSLAEENPDAFLPNVAATCNNLANLLDDQHRTEKAERLYQDALKIYRSLAGENPDAYLPNVAATCYNLAILLNNQHRLEDAERFYREALEIRRSLAKENPAAFLLEKSDTAFYLAILMYNIKHDLPASRALFEEALEGYSQFEHHAEDADEVRKILKEFF